LPPALQLVRRRPRAINPAITPLTTAIPRPITSPMLGKSGSRSLVLLDGLAAEAVTPTPDVPDRGRGEVHRAAQGAGVAVAFEKGAPGGRGLLLVVVDAHYEVRITRLDRRVDQIAGEHCLVAAAPCAHCEVIRRVAGSRGQPD